jgi:hypothetical protein
MVILLISAARFALGAVVVAIIVWFLLIRLGKKEHMPPKRRPPTQ